MDISSDSTVLASGSADKNLKIWGLDFGDCHRSLFAHGDSVMAVAFQPNTHYVFTASELFASACIAQKFHSVLSAPSACLTQQTSVSEPATPMVATAVSGGVQAATLVCSSCACVPPLLARLISHRTS